MFGSKKDKAFAKGGHTLFDKDVEIEGNVRFSGTLDIEGTVNGDVFASPGSDALIRVREDGCVNGDIRAPKIVINGKISGDVYSSGHLELAAKAEVNGNVHYQEIEMVKGAHVNGNLVFVQAEKLSSAKVEPLKKKEVPGAA